MEVTDRLPIGPSTNRSGVTRLTVTSRPTTQASGVARAVATVDGGQS